MINSYLTYLAQTKGLSAQTLKSYRNNLSQLQDWLQAHCIDLLTANSDCIQNYINYLNQDGKSTSSIKQSASTIRGFYRWAKHRGLSVDDRIRY
ncbi:site-specific integrase, partial [Nocardia farcinica]|uniref:site-specific integrase n=1 Tax=Nocardia farcinica TaxID=37329 RepID=UPI00189332FD|nr:site-specific integrase [Nocardia farcinica]